MKNFNFLSKKKSITEYKSLFDKSINDYNFKYMLTKFLNIIKNNVIIQTFFYNTLRMTCIQVE